MISNPRNLHPTAGLKVSDFTDIKPSNILLEPNKQGFRPKVTDFGIAKVTDAANAVVKKKGSTLAEARMGTPCYMSPEQVRAAKNVTNRSDIFSLGATLYELATLQTAFDGDSDYDIMHRIVESRYVPAENVGVDATIAAAIAKALQADPERRFASCEKFIEALSVPVRASVPPQPSPPAPVPAPVLVPTPPPVQPVASAPFVRPPLPSPTPPCAPATVEPARRPPPGRAKAAAPSRPQRSAFVSRASVLTLAVGAAYVAWPYIKREVRISRASPSLTRRCAATSMTRPKFARGSSMCRPSWSMSTNCSARTARDSSRSRFAASGGWTGGTRSSELPPAKRSAGCSARR